MRRPRPHSPQHDRDYGGNCREGSGGYSRRGRIEKPRQDSWRVLNGSPFFLTLNRPTKNPSPSIMPEVIGGLHFVMSLRWLALTLLLSVAQALAAEYTPEIF